MASPSSSPVFAAPHAPLRAPYACDPAASAGRRFVEAESRTRNPFARDRDRIIHTGAFRRLKEKTQVFVAHEGDYFRTRLTHSLEVAQIARAMAQAMGLDADLAETVALAHDLGHPPFGHAGEDELAKCMAGRGGFDHNVQTFRVVTELERRYPAFTGLNLTWETLEGVAKHNGPIIGHLEEPAYAYLAAYGAEIDLRPASFASAEAPVAALSDDIAYNNHDVDDGLQAGLFTLDDLSEIALIGPVIEGVRRDWPGLDASMLRLESVRRMIGLMVEDVMAETRRRAADSGVATADEVRALGYPLVAFSREMAEDLARLRAFLHARMYRHYRVNRTRSQARRILAELFALFLDEPETLPPEWVMSRGEGESHARQVCDYMAGMTDRFAIEEHRKLFSLDLWH